MEQKELLCFEWVVYDNCNLRCDYCVNKGEYSHRNKEEINYVKGIEIDIARRIIELSPLGKEVRVNLTGGEPLLAENISDVITILTANKKIKVKLITNFRLIHRIDSVIGKLDRILVSLHIKSRTDQEIENMIESLNRYKSTVPIIISQVDHDLNDEDRRKLNYIRRKTHMFINMQQFIPPWTDDTKDNKRISDSIYMPTKGKYCTLGYFYFLIHANGKFFSNLWCIDRNEIQQKNFLGDIHEVTQLLLSSKLYKCPESSCGCNYNTFHYGIYFKECVKLGLERANIMDRKNEIMNNRKLYNRAIQSLIQYYYLVVPGSVDPIARVRRMRIFQSNSKALRIFLYKLHYYL